MSPLSVLNIKIRRSFWRMAFRVVIDDVRHSLYNYHILFITRIILYIICDVFCALLHGLITEHCGYFSCSAAIQKMISLASRQEIAQDTANS